MKQGRESIFKPVAMPERHSFSKSCDLQPVWVCGALPLLALKPFGMRFNINSPLLIKMEWAQRDQTFFLVRPSLLHPSKWLPSSTAPFPVDPTLAQQLVSSLPQR
nr:hypothetical protein [Comamonas koreensis]